MMAHIKKRITRVLLLFGATYVLMNPLWAEEDSLVLASYQYKKYDRITALTPLSSLISEAASQPVNIVIASSPTELAQWMAQGKVAVAVPNLIGYLEMLRLDANLSAIAVPEKSQDPDLTGYTSSVIFNLGKKNDDFASLLSNDKASFYIVWPDSASGGLVGTTWLNENHVKSIANLVPQSQGSHDAVLKAVVETPGSFGVLATNVYLNSDLSVSDKQVKEQWRSPEIPFGPIVCQNSNGELCEAITTLLLQQNAHSQAALDGLISGWPEFEGSQKFIVPDEAAYHGLARTYSAVKEPSDLD